MLLDFIARMLDPLHLGVDAWNALKLARSIGYDHHLLWPLLRIRLGLHVVLLNFGLLPDRVLQMYHLMSTLAG